jgi:hypothetical protein
MIFSILIQRKPREFENLPSNVLIFCRASKPAAAVSGRDLNFMRDPELKIMDPAPDLDFNLIKNYPKNYQFDNYDIKNTLI